MLLEQKSKFSWGRPNTSAIGPGGMQTITHSESMTRPGTGKVNVEDFMRWSSGNMYRTSYNDMSFKVSPIMIKNSPTKISSSISPFTYLHSLIDTQ